MLMLVLDKRAPMNARFGNCTKAVEVSFGHADTSVVNEQALVGLVWSNTEAEFRLRLELTGVRQRGVAGERQNRSR